MALNLPYDVQNLHIESFAKPAFLIKLVSGSAQLDLGILVSDLPFQDCYLLFRCVFEVLLGGLGALNVSFDLVNFFFLAGLVGSELGNFFFLVR